MSINEVIDTLNTIKSQYEWSGDDQMDLMILNFDVGSKTIRSYEDFHVYMECPLDVDQRASLMISVLDKRIED